MSFDKNCRLTISSSILTFLELISPNVRSAPPTSVLPFFASTLTILTWSDQQYARIGIFCCVFEMSLTAGNHVTNAETPISLSIGSEFFTVSCVVTSGFVDITVRAVGVMYAISCISSVINFFDPMGNALKSSIMSLVLSFSLRSSPILNSP